MIQQYPILADSHKQPGLISPTGRTSKYSPVNYLELICFDLHCYSTEIRFFVVYRPPGYSNECVGYLSDILERIRLHYKTRNSSGDEIANVNFLYDDIVDALKIQ